MIGRLRGIIIEKQPPQLVLDVQGIGYEVFAPMSTFYYLPELQHEVTLYTHMVVREDAHFLYAFYKERERALFRALIKVNGVGPKLALIILSGIEPDHFVRCVREEDTSSLVGIPGIGKKTADRLIIETRDVLSQWQDSEPTTINTAHLPHHSDQQLQDAISALTALGYKLNEAKRAVSQIHTPQMSSEEIIRSALKKMISGKH